MDITIREEKQRDYKRVGLVIRKAFEDMPYSSGGEGKLVEGLRKRQSFSPSLSLVAEVEREIVGHILLTPIGIWGDKGRIPSLALAPLSVIPGLQREGIGTALVRQGLARARELGFRSVIVLGEPEYYSRFGFKPADLWKIETPPGIPPAYFLALELVEGGLTGVSGVVEYPEEFSGV
ncbi:MAG: N-acetyltransferase [Thermodesulfovibrionales bacterium]|jgi:predicted N-acetyltransferase YhbS